ncbi:LysR family transcriptional regulator [Rhodovulum sp. BSW8]|uniref:LysR family transcriptional regulator n=1 Tax=Rhodovulum visakhapatnamense TaxID=364297 RepID=A0A4V3GSH3_9RHOB|nr:MULTISPECIES: LysR substrate-binding domain-containing protein [Rhodovulum]OLS44283.1 LysR family transcriptional regulator [Rhodovulum sulfidophilum]MBL3569363.1 LysR family transcriptional regulator [Rhodovulum visakhapatnamense]MBL3576720.1 LysR family transcriptional regulator [Rhodovulum visakhapatnamense]RBO54351.1 LysR family transcriptional regulator [Rhodovulum sp. BSW8]TDX22883.1 LysR family transcriptional regulator [Rhodovulum visakhapatnamense]
MNITLRQLSYFIALAETRHFGRAAESVHVSQPALSVQIRELETDLGVQLVERQPRAVVLTPAGHDLLRHAQRVMQEVRALRDAARWQRGLGGRLSLGLIPTVAPYLLPKALPLIRAQNLTLEIGVREARTDRLLADLDEGRLDAALVALPVGRDDLIEAPLFEDRFLLAGSARQIAALGGETAGVRPAALDPDRLLLLDEGHCLADQALEVCGMRREETRVDLGASSLATLCGLAAEGFGLTFLPEIALVSERAASPALAVHRFASPEPARRLGLVRRRLSRDDGWFEALAAILAEAGRSLTDSARAAAGG